MANALVIRPGTQLSKGEKELRAAQYVRMSTDYQRYSIENQAAVIAAYAQAHDISIVRTYRDQGESGLTLKRRPGLAQLLDDVQMHRADFDHILVYDVSRWGRFQDVDESAHYEFICKQAGVVVSYCAEQFENDGSLVSSVVKNIKRVMAAEYSRELSIKVHAGACRMASMGYKSGGPTPYALQRVLVDETSQPKQIMTKGERKYLQTDHVRLQPGPLAEVTVVRWIFQRFLNVKSCQAVANELNRREVPPCSGERWTGPKVGRILKNENYIGTIIYNRASWKLRAKRTQNPPDKWIRSSASFESIVSAQDFLAVRKIINERRVVGLTEGEMLVRLRQTLLTQGRLCSRLVDRTAGLPSYQVYCKHFGTLRNAYRMIGYKSSRNLEYFDNRKIWLERLSQLQAEITEQLLKAGRHVDTNELADGLRINERNVYFRVAHIQHPGKTHVSPSWYVQRRNLPDGWIVALRLADQSRSLLDYILLPTIRTDLNTIRFSERRRAQLGIMSFQTPDNLIQSLNSQFDTPLNIATTAHHSAPLYGFQRDHNLNFRKKPPLG